MVLQNLFVSSHVSDPYGNNDSTKWIVESKNFGMPTSHDQGKALIRAVSKKDRMCMEVHECIASFPPSPLQRGKRVTFSEEDAKLEDLGRNFACATNSDVRTRHMHEKQQAKLECLLRTLCQRWDEYQDEDQDKSSHYTEASCSAHALNNETSACATEPVGKIPRSHAPAHVKADPEESAKSTSIVVDVHPEPAVRPTDLQVCVRYHDAFIQALIILLVVACILMHASASCFWASCSVVVLLGLTLEQAAERRWVMTKHAPVDNLVRALSSLAFSGAETLRGALYHYVYE